MWTVRLSYSLPGQDVVVAQFLGEENVIQLAVHLFESEPCPVQIFPLPMYVTEDYSKAYVYLFWENKEAFDTWYSVNGEDWEALLAESNAYGAQQGIVFERTFPPHEDYDWSNDSPTDLVVLEDVFQHLSNAQL